MGIFNDFKKMYEEMDDEIPQFNPYNPTYIKDRIRVLKANPVRNRFKVGNSVRDYSFFRNALSLLPFFVTGPSHCGAGEDSWESLGL